MPMRSLVKSRAPAPLTLAYIAVILAGAAAGAVLQGAYPTADNALFEYCGRAIARGYVLYRDVWDNKLPGVYYVNALWQLLFGDRYKLHAIAEVLVALASAGLLIFVMRAFGVGFGAPAAAVLTAFLCIVFPLNTTEAYALPLLLAAILAAYGNSAILSGTFAGVAALFWLPSLLILWPLAPLLHGRWLPRVALMNAIAIGVPLAAVVLVAGPAHFAALVQTWLPYALARPETRVHHHIAFLNRFAAAWQILENFWGGAVAAGVAPLGVLLLAIFRKPETQAQRFGLFWTAAMLVAVLAGARFYSHYFIACFTAMIFTICAYAPEARLRWPQAALIFAGILLLGETFTVRAADNSRDRSAIALRLTHAAAPIVAGRLTLDIDSYRPELYLALDPLLRSPYEIVEKAIQSRALGSLPRMPHHADVVVATKRTSLQGSQVCVRTAAPWRMYVQARLRHAFIHCM